MIKLFLNLFVLQTGAAKAWVVLRVSLLAEVSHNEAKWNDRRETSAGFQRVVWWSRRPNFWSKLSGFQNRFRLMCNARALLDCTLTIIEPTADYGFHEICEFRNFSLWSTVSTLGDKCMKEITSLQRKVILGFLKGRHTCACLPTGYGKTLIFASSWETSASRETIPSVAGHTSLVHKSLSPQKGKSQIVINQQLHKAE